MAHLLVIYFLVSHSSISCLEQRNNGFHNTYTVYTYIHILSIKGALRRNNLKLHQGRLREIFSQQSYLDTQTSIRSGRTSINKHFWKQRKFSVMNDKAVSVLCSRQADKLDDLFHTYFL